MLHDQLLLMRWVYEGGLILNCNAGYNQFLILSVMTKKIKQEMLLLKSDALLGIEGAENWWAAFLHTSLK
jgi:hypothetical protein